ncbi:hypothetical protein E2986_13452 [Frieseomelitta varia]|uniref:Odorant receptor n=1 Tax=Frieseomelitta varia TaxID=561572 RepID=A0A833RVJ9_9HYME|nr:hypothetical protein E2986_13452 [Frieseomelitta varia]
MTPALENQYLGDMKFFMQLVGMWPYQERFAKLSTRLFSFLVVIYAFITEVYFFFTIDNVSHFCLSYNFLRNGTNKHEIVSRVVVFYNTKVLLDQMVYLDIIIIIFAKQYQYVLNATKLKELLREIVADRMLEYPKEELEMLDSYFNKAVYFCFVYKVVSQKCKIYSLEEYHNIIEIAEMYLLLIIVIIFYILHSLYIGVVYFSALAYLLTPAISPILNIIKPLNESRSYELIYPAYYFVDEQQYYFVIITHMAIGVIILITVYIASDLCLIYVIHHGCALLTISGYRFKHAFDEVSQSEGKDNDVLQDANSKVCRAIKGHKKAIEYIHKINNCYVHYFLIILGLIIIAFTSTFLRLSMMEKGTTYYVFCMFTVAELFHLFFLMSMGQIVVNIHDEVYQTICEANWYNGAPKTQLLYVLVLRKCLSSPVLTGERLIPLNLFSFVQVLKVSFSYYTAVGLWPHQGRFAKLTIRIITFLVIIVTFSTEISRVIVFYSTDVLLDEMVYMDIAISIFVKQYHYILNEKKIRDLLNEIVIDRLTKYPKEELEILDMYYNKAKFICTIYKGILKFTAVGYISLPAIPSLLNIIKPLNESRGRELVYPAYYFVDEQRYYFPIITHMVMAVIVLNVVYMASDISLIYIIHHACSLLSISGYQFKHSFDEVSRCDEKDNDVRQKANVYRAINGHKRAVDQRLLYALLLATLGPNNRSIHIQFREGRFQSTNKNFIAHFYHKNWETHLSMMEKGFNYYVFCLFTFAQLFHLFFLMSLGQFVINVHDEVYQSIYEAKWYNGASKTQLLYVLVLRKCLNSPALTGEGLIPLNFYSFVQVLKLSFSYYTTVEDQYLRDNKFFAQLVGVWPYQERFTKFSIRLVIFVLVIIALATQASRVIVSYSIDALMDEVVYLVITVTVPIKQYNYILNEKKLEELLREIVFDHLMERPKKEMEILDTYYRKALIFSFIYKASISTSALTFILIPAIPPILNIIAPLNESRGREFVYPAYFFVDEQRYYYPILVNMIISALVLASVYIACDVNLIHLIHHGCALLAISGYRFKHALDDVNLYDEKYNDALMHEAYAKVCRSIEGHKRAVEYVEKIDACYVHYFFVLLGIIITAFTSTFIRLSTMEMDTRYFTFCIFTFAQLVHLLFLTIMGQIVENSNNEVSHKIIFSILVRLKQDVGIHSKTYEANWYTGSSRTQLLYVLVLRKCLNPPALSGGGLVPLNLFSFVQVLKASFSYFTNYILHSRLCIMNRATLEKRHLNITKSFAKLGGIWPNQNKFVKVILWAVVDISMVSSMIVQTARIIRIGTLDVVIEQSSLIGAAILMIIKHGNYILNATKLENLLNDMSEDWATNRLKEEFEIMTTYANRGSFLAKFYFANAGVCALLFIQMPWSARLFHMIRQQNTSPPVTYSIPGYYFVEDDREYYYYIQLHLALCIYVVLVVFISCDTLYMVLVQHGCGQLTVAG